MLSKKILIPFSVLFICFILAIGTTSFYKPLSSFLAPAGYTGATGAYCTGCHSGNPLNSTGGLVTVAGLPAGTYTAGQTYNFSITITHSLANRQRWGFSIIAVNAAGNAVGSFASNNPNAAINGNELSHQNAVSTSAQSSYSYNNLSWTAPSTVTGDNQTIRFYYVGNAADRNFSSSGDFIYAGSLTVTAAVPVCATNNWTGTVSNAWENPANWSCEQIPDSTMNVSIQSPAPNYPVVNSFAFCKSITTAPGVEVIVTDGKRLTVTGRQ